MIRRLPAFLCRHPLAAATLLVAWALCAVPAEAKVNVNCNQPGQSIGAVLATNPDPDLVIVVKGMCVENVVIERDDVTIRTKGVAPPPSSPPTPPARHPPGWRPPRRDRRRRAAGLTVSGGTFGISANRGSTLDVRNCAVTGASNTGDHQRLRQHRVGRRVLGHRQRQRRAAANTASLSITQQHGQRQRRQRHRGVAQLVRAGGTGSGRHAHGEAGDGER